MKWTIRWLSAYLLLVLTVGCQPPGTPETELTLESESEQTLYAIGFLAGTNLAPFYFEEEDLQVVLIGLRDAVTGREAKVDARKFRPQIQQLRSQRAGKAADVEKEASQAFLEAEAAREGAVREESGLIYIEQTAGTGASPTAEDIVVMHYHGTLRDGTVFDSSVERDQPFRTRLNSVIPCWTQAVPMMKVGGKARLVCPSDLAYGNRGAGGKIKPGAALAFDVELLEIEAKP